MTTTTLIIARHGNTFEAHQTPTRVGARTDLPLTETGREQARTLGQYLKQNGLIPETVYASGLRRTIETARLAIAETGVTNPVYSLDIFNEIDYGVDENKPEADVIARIGADAIKAWDENGVVPDGWNANPQEIIRNWMGFADMLAREHHNEISLVITSNGIARFAPHITGDFDGFRAAHSLKLSTGAFGILRHDEKSWTVLAWNVKP